MSKSTNTEPDVRSVRHQQVLDLAADNPEASLQKIAEEIPSATTELVERVLDKYGDPADDDSHVDTDSPDTMTGTTSLPDRTELTEKELQTLRVIHEQPDATQREVAEVLGVSGATISNRVNGIDGFEWEDRSEFTTAIFDEPPGETAAPETATPEPTAVPDGATQPTDKSTTDDSDVDTPNDSPQPDSDTDSIPNSKSEPNTDPDPNQNPDSTSQSEPGIDRSTVDQLSNRLTAIEAKLEAVQRDDGTESVLEDPELAHKVLHACLESDAISEEEELQLLRTILE